MALETVHVEFDHGGEHFDVAFQEEEGPSTGRSVEINGRRYTLKGQESQLDFVWRSIEFALGMDTSSGKLLDRLNVQPDVSNLRVTSSLTPAELAERMDSYVRRMQDERGFHGAVLVQQGGERLIYRGYGAADPSGRPIDEHTRFCIGSVTKQFIGVAIMLLVQEGRIPSPDMEINVVLPERFRRAKWDGITVRDLLTHASGIPSYGAEPEDEGRGKLFTVDEVVAQFIDKELEFPRGEMHHYSNGNYALLGAIIEQSSGLSLEEFMKSRIFDRRGIEMGDTGMTASYAQAASAVGFMLDPEGEERGVDPSVMPIHLSKAYAAGSIVSSLADMERWDAVFSDDSFLTPASRRELAKAEERVIYDPEHFEYAIDAEGRARPEEGVDYPRARYGFGVGVGGAGEQLLHGGRIPGYTAFVARNTENDNYVTILANQDLDDGTGHPLTETMALHLWEMLSW